VQFQASESRLPIVTRPQALRRVMTNLLDNALKFGERADIVIDDSSEQVVIHIIDGGPGIPDAELEAVLQPFYRVETSRNRDTGGTGLGLAIAAQLTAQLDGKLKLANRAEGAGCLRYATATLIVRLCISFREDTEPDKTAFYTYPEHIRTMK
jgi:signal transduction histidine kinase